jgi:hypothetical protein
MLKFIAGVRFDDRSEVLQMPANHAAPHHPKTRTAPTPTMRASRSLWTCSSGMDMTFKQLGSGEAPKPSTALSKLEDAAEIQLDS